VTDAECKMTVSIYLHFITNQTNLDI